MNVSRVNGFAAFALSLALIPAALATQFVVVDAKFERSTVQVESLTSDRITGVVDGRPFDRATRDLVLMQRIDRMGGNDQPALQLVLRDGQQLTGEPAGLQEDSIVWSTPLGKRTVPLAQVGEIIRINSDTAAAKPTTDAATQDTLYLANGDRVSGILTEIDAESVVCQTADGQQVRVDWASVRAVVLAKAGDAKPASTDWRISLTDGTVMDVDRLTISGERVKLIRDGEESQLAASMLLSAEHVGGRARLLTRLTPTTSEYAAFFPRIGSGSSIVPPSTVRVEDDETRSFLAMRPYSKMTWTLDGSATMFRTRIAGPEASPFANCQVRIWLDSKCVLQESDSIKPVASEPINIPLGAAKTLTLEVDFGENFDVQDQVFWIEPALISE